MADNDYEFHTGDRCGIDGCRSRRYRTNETGYEECDRGHQHGLTRGNIANDEDEFGINLRGKRFRKESQREKISKYLKGKDAFELYLLCFQLVLRKQVWWLVHDNKMPKQLETIVHDLWALRIQGLRAHVNHESQPGGDAVSSSEEAENPFQAQDHEETDKEADVASAGRLGRGSRIPNLRQGLATIYLATQILRLPVLISDIHLWVKSGSLLYYDAATALPKEMIGRLDNAYANQFKPMIHLTGASLFFEVTRIALLYNKNYGMIMPALNVPTVLFRLVEELALPLEVYYAVRKLAVYLKFNFTYPTIKSRHITIIDFPEAQILACIVIVLKIFHGLDGIDRVPMSETSPAAVVLDWDRWERLMKEYEPLELNEAIQMTDQRVLDLSDARIDDYLDFFQDRFLIQDPRDNDRDVDFQRTMLALFPLGSPRTKQGDVIATLSKHKVENVQAMERTLRPSRVVDDATALDVDEEVVRPGEQYKPTRNFYQETGLRRTLFERLSQSSGLSPRSIARAVVHAENLLKNMRRGPGKRGRPKKTPSKAAEEGKHGQRKANLDALSGEQSRNEGSDTMMT